MLQKLGKGGSPLDDLSKTLDIRLRKLGMCFDNNKFDLHKYTEDILDGSVEGPKTQIMLTPRMNIINNAKHGSASSGKSSKVRFFLL